MKRKEDGRLHAVKTRNNGNLEIISWILNEILVLICKFTADIISYLAVVSVIRLIKIDNCQTLLYSISLSDVIIIIIRWEWTIETLQYQHYKYIYNIFRIWDEFHVYKSFKIIVDMVSFNLHLKDHFHDI